MIVFWWTGRGYTTVLIWMLTMTAFGIMLAAGQPILQDRPWFWGLAFLSAAGLNWHFGSRLNQKSLRKARPVGLQQRLLYRARHRFMSMPMETFSIILAGAGIAIEVYGVLDPAAKI